MTELLTLEQQFQLQQFSQSLNGYSEQQIRELLKEKYAQFLLQKNIFNQRIKQNWRL